MSKRPEAPVKKTVRDWLKVMVLLLDEAAAVVLVIVVLRWFKVQIPLPVMIAAALLFGALVFIIHRAVIPSFHWRPVSGSEGMIGTTGTVIKALTPVGTVTVSGERWKARAVADNIEVDEDVEIVSLKGLILEVKRKDH